MAHGLDWFKFHTEDYLIGTEVLSWEEQGVYVRLLANMYDRNGPLPDDDRIIARLLLGDIRAWRRVKAKLIAKNKIKVTSAGIINVRVMQEIDMRQEKSKKASEAAHHRWSISKQSISGQNDEIRDSSSVATPELRDSYPTAIEQQTEDRLENVNKNNDRPVKTHKRKNAIEREIENKNNPLPPKGGPSPQDALQAFGAWNETALRCGLPQAAKLTKDRQRKIIARLREYGSDGWSQALANIERSSFLTGSNDRNFRADLDFLLQAKSFGRVHDGGYGNGRHAKVLTQAELDQFPTYDPEVLEMARNWRD